jgi:AraC-like DNA-binding protein
MPGSVTSVFSEADEFGAALLEEGYLGLLVTGPGAFRARLTQVALHRIRLSAAEEYLPRIAVVAVPHDMILVSLANRSGPSPIWGGTETRAGDMITLGPGQRVHMRTGGPCRWTTIRMPEGDFVDYGQALSGTGFDVPPMARWRPPPAARRELRQLHQTAVRMAEARSRALADVEAVHGLEQQLIHALIDCLSAGSTDEETPAARRHRGILTRFEDFLHAEAFPGMTEICGALGVSERTLRVCCEEQLGMGPTEYIRRGRMQLVHRALRKGNPDAASISAVARRYGFRGLGRFAANYRALFGELPSATLRRGSGQTMARLTLHRPPRRI